VSTKLIPHRAQESTVGSGDPGITEEIIDEARQLVSLDREFLVLHVISLSAKM